MRHLNIRTVRSLLALLTASLVLAACGTGYNGRPFFGGPNYQSNRPQGFTVSSLNGTWRPAGDVAGEYVSIFQDGRFVSRDPANPDHEALLAQGVYTVTQPDLVQIDFVGAVSGRSVKATCQLAPLTAQPNTQFPQPNSQFAQSNTMTCTPNLGAPFTLVRI